LAFLLLVSVWRCFLSLVSHYESLLHVPLGILYVPFFASLEVMSRVSIALHLPVAYNDITRQLANNNVNYKFSACPYSILREFAVENEVTVTSHPEIGWELHLRCICSSKVLKRFAFITDRLAVSWILILNQLSAVIIHHWLHMCFTRAIVTCSRLVTETNSTCSTVVSL